MTAKMILFSCSAPPLPHRSRLGRPQGPQHRLVSWRIRSSRLSSTDTTRLQIDWPLVRRAELAE